MAFAINVYNLLASLLKVLSGIITWLLPASVTHKSHDGCEASAGLRGWVTFRILLSHACRTVGIKPIYSLFNEVFLNDPLCVSILFVLTGDILTCKAITPENIIERIPRLSGVVTIGMMFLYICYLFGWVCESVNTDWLEAGWACEGPLRGKSFFDFLSFGWVNIYRPEVPNPFDNFLWIVSVELSGGCVAFCLSLALNALTRYRTAFLLIVFGYVLRYYDANYTFFVAGVTLGHLRTIGVFDWVHAHTLTRVIADILVIGLPFTNPAGDYIYFAWLNKLGIFRFKEQYYAILCVLILYTSRDATSFMRNPIMHYFGNIYFCLYCTHRIVIKTYWATLMSSWGVGGDVPVRVWILLSGLPIALVLASIAHFIEVRYIGLLKRGSEVILTPKK